jgi:hypothetical protein
MTKKRAIEVLEKFAAANDELEKGCPYVENAAVYKGVAKGLRKAIEIVEQIEDD